MISLKTEKVKATITDLYEAASAARIPFQLAYGIRQNESKHIGEGWLPDGTLISLFECHWFSRLTNRKYDTTHPDISNEDRYGTKSNKLKYGKYSQQLARITKAASLNEEAALQSASWGLFQIMGFNFKQAGYNSVYEMIEDYKKGEVQQIKSFCKYIKNDPNILKFYLKGNIARVSEIYNGSDYRANNYDTKLVANIKEAEQKYPEYCVPKKSEMIVVPTESVKVGEDNQQINMTVPTETPVYAPEKLLIEAPEVKTLSQSREIKTNTAIATVGAGTAATVIYDSLKEVKNILSDLASPNLAIIISVVSIAIAGLAVYNIYIRTKANVAKLR